MRLRRYGSSGRIRTRDHWFWAYGAKAKTAGGPVGSLVLVMSNLPALLLWNGSVSRYETFVA